MHDRVDYADGGDGAMRFLDFTAQHFAVCAYLIVEAVKLVEAEAKITNPTLEDRKRMMLNACDGLLANGAIEALVHGYTAKAEAK